MRKDIIIQEGGVGRQLSVNKLKTGLSGGGSCLWVPEDEVQLGTKTITKNGTYKANGDGYYGYSQVIVSGIGTTRGKDPDGSGDEAVARVDPITGEIVVEKVPSSIAVTTPPNVTIYGDGAYIGFDGIVVTAYNSNGVSMGEVPFDELVFPVKIADYESGTPSGAIIDDITINIGTSSVGTDTHGDTYTDTFDGGYGVLTHINAGLPNVRSVFASTMSGVTLVHSSQRRTLTYPLDRVYTVDGSTVYYVETSGPDWVDIAPLSSGELMKYPAEQIAFAMIFDSMGERRRQTIPVQWSPVGDGEVIETSFSISVIPGPGQGDD